MTKSTETQDDALKGETDGESVNETVGQPDTNDQKNTETSMEKKPGKISTYIKTHKMVIFLVLVLIVFGAWAFIRMNVMNSKFEKQQTKLIENYEHRIDSINGVNLQTTSKVFAWAIRSELIRQNQDQVNQYFLTYIHEPKVLKISYIDNVSSKILISTDKKEEGTQYGGTEIAKDSTFIQLKDSTFNVITPVMGLNQRLGTLVIDYKK